MREYLVQSKYEGALALERRFPKKTANGLALACFILALLFLAPAVLLLNERLLGLALIATAFWLVFLIYSLFLGFLQTDPDITPVEVKSIVQSSRFGELLTFFAARCLQRSVLGNRFYLLGFFRFLLKQENFLWLLGRLAVAPKTFEEKVVSGYAADAHLSVDEVLRAAARKALAGQHVEIRYSDILLAIYELDSAFQKIMFEFDVEAEDLAQVAAWYRRRRQERAARGRFWSRERLLSTPGLGKGWAGGYTVRLDSLAQDLTRQAEMMALPPHLYGRSQEVENLSRLLVQGAGNAVLVGLPGSGRHTVLKVSAYLVGRGLVWLPLQYKRLLQIDSSAIISGVTGAGQVVAQIERLFGEAYRAGNVILVVNDIDALFDPAQEAGRFNATEALLPFLQSRLHVVGITTPGGYQSTIGKNTQLMRFMPKLEIREATPPETLMILEDAVARTERGSGLKFSYFALKEMVMLATKLIQNLPNPEKSLEILEDTAVSVATKTGDTEVGPEHVRAVVSVRTKIPVEQVTGAEKETLLNLEDILHQRIVNQSQAINVLADALRRARSGVRSEKKPIGVFLFLGPTGVGKTETTKALAAIYFGSEQKIIRFDMAEFQEVRGIARFIGDPDTGQPGLLTEAVISSPFSLILLDELEKAHPKILDLFLPVFDEGRLTDALGRVVSFTNTMIIATSNAGSETIRQMVKGGEDLGRGRERLLDELLKQGVFKAEFVNRFDAVVLYRPLDQSELTQVAALLLQELNQRLADKDVQINVTAELAAAVARGGYSPEFGARPLRRFIQENIENFVAKGLLSGSIKRGDVVEINPTDLQGSGG